MFHELQCGEYAFLRPLLYLYAQAPAASRVPRLVLAVRRRQPLKRFNTARRGKHDLVVLQLLR